MYLEYENVWYKFVVNNLKILLSNREIILLYYLLPKLFLLQYVRLNTFC